MHPISCVLAITFMVGKESGVFSPASAGRAAGGAGAGSAGLAAAPPPPPPPPPSSSSSSSFCDGLGGKASPAIVGAREEEGEGRGR